MQGALLQKFFQLIDLHTLIVHWNANDLISQCAEQVYGGRVRGVLYKDRIIRLEQNLRCQENRLL